MFDLRTVDYFLTAVRRGSLRAAAQELGVTQPALTKAIRRLEDSFGAPLFDRRARGVTPTVYGTALLRHARDLKAALSAAREEVDALRSGGAGFVKIGAGPSWQDAVLPDAIAELRASRPGVRIHVTGGGDDQLKEQLKSGALDFVLAAVPETPRIEPELAWKPLLADEYCVIADVRHPLRRRKQIKAEDLLGYPWILPPATTYMVGRLQHVLRAAGLPAPVPAVETDVIPLKFALMRGAEYLSYHAAAHLSALDPGFIAPIEVPGTTAVRHAGLINRRGVDFSPAAKALVGILQRLCSARARPRGRAGAGKVLPR
jgi:DNA-binding transcriptional LysR family regulator